MTVKSLSNMMKSGVVLAGGDCDTCGPNGAPSVVTRVAMANMAKLNTPVQKVAAAPKAVAQPKPAELPIQTPTDTETIVRPRGRPFAKKVASTDSGSDD